MPDHRELKYRHMEMLAPNSPLPLHIDRTGQQSPVKDQGEAGSCSGFSAIGYAEFLALEELRLRKPPNDDPQVFIHGHFDPMSEDFTYANERIREGSLNEDAGATTLRDACLSLTRDGVCREVTWPYIPQNLLKKPNAAAYAEAAKHKVGHFYAIDHTAYELQRCLANGNLILFGMIVFDSMMGSTVGANGHVPDPGYNDRQVGGHALLCVGYDNRTRLYKFKNSWGRSWGDSGYGYISYNYMHNTDLTDDHFMLTRHPKLSLVPKLSA